MVKLVNHVGAGAHVLTGSNLALGSCRAVVTPKSCRAVVTARWPCIQESCPSSSCTTWVLLAHSLVLPRLQAVVAKCGSSRYLCKPQLCSCARNLFGFDPERSRQATPHAMYQAPITSRDMWFPVCVSASLAAPWFTLNHMNDDDFHR